MTRQADEGVGPLWPVATSCGSISLKRLGALLVGQKD